MRIHVFLFGLWTVSGTNAIDVILHFKDPSTAILNSTQNAFLLSARFPLVQGIVGRGVCHSIAT